MEGNWTIFNNHLAFEGEGAIFHPSAKDIYSIFEGLLVKNKNYPNPKIELSDIRFSKLGSELKAVLKNNEEGKIYLDLFVERRGEIIPVDFYNGRIIDQCVHNESWFYNKNRKCSFFF